MERQEFDLPALSLSVTKTRNDLRVRGFLGVQQVVFASCLIADIEINENEVWVGSTCFEHEKLADWLRENL